MPPTSKKRKISKVKNDEPAPKKARTEVEFKDDQTLREIDLMQDLYGARTEKLKLRVKEERREAGFRYETTTVKTGLKSLIKSSKLQRILMPVVASDVEYITKGMKIFTLFFNWLVQKKIDDADFFNKLDENVMRKLFNKLRDGKGDEVKEFMTISNVEMPENHKYRTSIVQNSLRQFSANLKTTIRTNLPRTLRVYFNYIDEDRKKESRKKNQKHVKDILAGKIEENPWKINFKKLKDFDLIPTMFNLQKIIFKEQRQQEGNGVPVQKGLRTLSVLPIWNSQQKNVLYDKAAFNYLLNQIRSRKRAMMKKF